MAGDQGDKSGTELNHAGSSDIKDYGLGFKNPHEYTYTWADRPTENKGGDSPVSGEINADYTKGK